MEQEIKKKKKHGPVFWTLISINIVIDLIIVIVGGYLLYIVASYSRIGNVSLDVTNNSTLDLVNTSETYSITTYNIGFGAYSQNYTFFLDSGYDDNGNETVGYYGKALSKDDVLFNTNGAIKTIQEKSPDFALFQEVDTNSTRSYHVNQYEKITSNFTTYDQTFCSNFHSAFLPYPLYDMHGSVQAGLAIMSKYKVTSANRYEYTISNSMSKFFDLDRCFAVNTISVSNGKTLYIVNSHMSAYDSGGTIRKQQMLELNNFLTKCQENGDYVIVGGDYNHDLITYNPSFSYTNENRAFNMTKKAPDWIAYFFNEDGTSELIDGYSVYADDSNPTCRNNDVEWDPNNTFVCVVDGYIVSNNITVSLVQNIQTKQGNKNLDGFAYSDHEPVYMEFSLN
jgi:endonuclease/exonuclease/phosphatase family metal-dependent hydrolase